MDVDTSPPLLSCKKKENNIYKNESWHLPSPLLPLPVCALLINHPEDRQRGPLINTKIYIHNGNTSSTKYCISNKHIIDIHIVTMEVVLIYNKSLFSKLNFNIFTYLFQIIFESSYTIIYLLYMYRVVCKMRPFNIICENKTANLFDWILNRSDIHS